MRVVALLATYNERRFVGGCIEHLHAHGVETYLIDNCSTDDTVAIAERHLGRGLIGIETFPRAERFQLRALLERKQQLAGELDADWFIHLDADERRLPPPGQRTLAEALAAVDRDGYNAVHFMEFTFIPTREQPDHDHADFERTLRTYYPFAPRPTHQLKAWKAGDVELASSAGHLASIPELRLWPERFPMKHYLFLSVPHAIEKYVERVYDPEAVATGWHGWRARLSAEEISLPSAAELRVSRSDDDLDAGDPRTRHHLDPLSRTPARDVPAGELPIGDVSPLGDKPDDGAPLVVCILGKSRSGTSLTARIVNLLGVSLGPDDELMPPAAGNNPKGFWEHQGIAALDERVLAALSDPPPQIRQAWRWPPPLLDGWELDERLDGLREEAREVLRESFGDAPAWGWKDPRSCLTLPFWRQLVPEPRYVICVRHPLDVAASLEARDAMAHDEALTLWLLYMSHAVLNTRGGRRLVVAHERYFPAWEAQAERLARFLDLPAISAAQRSAIAGHLEEGLWHHRDGAQREAAVGAETAALYALLTALSEADGEAGSEAQAALDAAARRGAAAAAPRFGHESWLSA